MNFRLLYVVIFFSCSTPPIIPITMPPIKASLNGPIEETIYSDYLKLEEILNNQKLKRAERGTPAHDEMLFIIIHQVYELWFKQIIHELDSVLLMFSKVSISESDVSLSVTRLDRIIEIQKILIDQVRILETMTAMDFLEFRDHLFPSSGFQSSQFRKLENKLGLKKADRPK